MLVTLRGHRIKVRSMDILWLFGFSQSITSFDAHLAMIICFQ